MVENSIDGYHGMPVQYLEAGDPYHCQCLKTTRLVREYLGWPEDKIHVIDIDQGHSGASAADRERHSVRGDVEPSRPGVERDQHVLHPEDAERVGRVGVWGCAREGTAHARARGTATYTVVCTAPAGLAISNEKYSPFLASICCMPRYT